jgi:hypothetical protein
MHEKLKLDLLTRGFKPERRYLDPIESMFADHFYYLDNGLPNFEKMNRFTKKINIKSDHFAKCMSKSYGGEIDQLVTFILDVTFENNEYYCGLTESDKKPIFSIRMIDDSDEWNVSTISDIEIFTKKFCRLKRFKFKTLKTKETLYVIAHQNRIKIGVTDNIFQRFKTIQMQSPYKLKLILFSFQIEGVDKLEKSLHLIFKNQRFHGEWFELSDFHYYNLRSIVDEVMCMSYEDILKLNKSVNDLRIREARNVLCPFYPYLSMKEEEIIMKKTK